jgi:hypothetical protein
VTDVARALIPNSTQVPDVILDHWMAELSGAEFKVLLYVARRTYGFGKDADDISLSQLASGIRRRNGTTLDRGTGLSRSGVKAACNGLIARGLLVRTANTSPDGREPEESTYRLNLFAQVPDPAAGVGQKSADPGQKSSGGRPARDGEVGQNLAPQETGQETGQHPAPAVAENELVGALTGRGVSRAVAVRLAAEKPDICRRCLEYLPYARVRTTPGAWLADAIRCEYGPPAGFPQTGTRTTPPAAGPTAAEAARRVARLRVEGAFARLEGGHPAAAAAFAAFLDAERGRTERFAGRLTPAGRAATLAGFDDPVNRLALFERWRGGAGKSYGLFGDAGPRAASHTEAITADGGRSGNDPGEHVRGREGSERRRSAS